MDNLPIQAIVFIYPDGFVETVPITKYPHHIESLVNHLEHLKRFSNLCFKYKFKFQEYVNYMPIANQIAKEGVISLYNFNIREIIQDSSILETDLPSFFVYIPEKMGSLEQTKQLERILDYPKEKLSLNYYKKNKYREVAFEEIEKLAQESIVSFEEQLKL